MASEEIFKFCFGCKKDTLHRRVAGISRPLYQCSAGCGAPAREVSDASQRAAAPDPKPEAGAGNVAPKSGEKKKRAYTRREKPEATPVNAKKSSPLHAAVMQVVESVLKDRAPSLTRADVVEIVRQELLGGAAPAAKGACPRGVHKGIHGKKCREAGYVG